MRRLCAFFITVFILTPAFSGYSASKWRKLFDSGDLLRIYPSLADTAAVNPDVFIAPVLRDVTYSYIYNDFYEQVRSDIYSNSPLSKFFALQFINHIEEFSVVDFPEAMDISTMLDALCEAYYQNNVYIGGIELNQIMYDFHSMTLKIPYALSSAEQRKLQEEITAKANSIIAQIITESMSDYQKAAAINNYLCKNAKFDSAAKEALLSIQNGTMISNTYKYSQTAYGVLINQRGICQSYAEAFKLLAGKAGLTSIVVTGILNGSGSHMWNRVYANGWWLTLDVTNSGRSVNPDEFFDMSQVKTSVYYTEDKLYLLDSMLSVYRN